MMPLSPQAHTLRQSGHWSRAVVAGSALLLAVLSLQGSYGWAGAWPLLVVGSAFSLGPAAAWMQAAAGGAVAAILAAQGAPGGWIGGVGTAVLGSALLCHGKEREQRSLAEGFRKQEIEDRVRLRQLRRQRERGRRRIAELEEGIQEISQLYQLSRQFLATLDREQGQRIAGEALTRWVPSLSDADRAAYLHQVDSLVEKGQVSVEALIQAMPMAGTDFSARERWGMVAGQLALGLQRISLYQQVQALATHDSLTGFLVRRSFLQRLAEEVDRAKRREAPVCFLMVDLDEFKKVNDRYGHLVGDVVLREVAGLIRGSVREMDLAGRYGGEEFGVVLPEAGTELGVQIAERIRLAVEAALIRAYDEVIRITVSIGVSGCPIHAQAADRLIERADEAMYRAKAQGRNRCLLAG